MGLNESSANVQRLLTLIYSPLIYSSSVFGATTGAECYEEAALSLMQTV